MDSSRFMLVLSSLLKESTTEFFHKRTQFLNNSDLECHCLILEDVYPSQNSSLWAHEKKLWNCAASCLGVCFFSVFSMVLNHEKDTTVLFIYCSRSHLPAQHKWEMNLFVFLSHSLDDHKKTNLWLWCSKFSKYSSCRSLQGSAHTPLMSDSLSLSLSLHLCFQPGPRISSARAELSSHSPGPPMSVPAPEPTGWPWASAPSRRTPSWYGWRAPMGSETIFSCT